MKKKPSFLSVKIVMAAAALLALLSFTTCQSLMAVIQEPAVSLQSAELVNIDFNGIQLLCKVEIDNPNAFQIPFPETDWGLFINTNSFISGTIKNDDPIRARQKTVVEVPVYLEYLGIFNTFMSLKGSKSANYKVALDFKFTLPVIDTKVLHIEHEGELPLLQLPKLSAPSMKVDSVNTTRAEIVVSVNIDNPNIFALPPLEMSYDYKINRNSFIKGSVESAQLAAGAATPVNFRLTVTYAELFKSFVSLLLAGSEVQSAISFTGDYGIPAFLGEKFNLDLAGTLPLRR